MSGNLAITHTVRHGGSGLSRAMAGLWAQWRMWLKLRETRRYLSQMDEHMLHDIGVSRAQALFELDLPRRPGKHG